MPQHAARLLIILCWLVLAGSAQAALGDRGRDDAIVIPLKKNLRMLIRPTMLGLVPPADPRSYGEMFVRVTALADGQASLYFEVKEALPGADTRADETTRIRRGDITVTGLAAATTMIAPMFWPGGDFTTDSGLIWLSRGVYDRLLRRSKVDWQLDFALEPIPGEFHALNDYIAGLTGEDEDAEPVAIQLIIEDRDARYPCEVNGERTQLDAIRAVDSLGLAEYWILADAANPLLLKMSFIPPAGGFADGEPLGLTQAGAGYAVIEIDF